MRAFGLSLMLSCGLISHALAWGREGHSIVAEIAQRRLSHEAAAAVEQQGLCLARLLQEALE